MTTRSTSDPDEVREVTEPELVVILYQQGRSAREVGDLMGLSANNVNKIVRTAGVTRTPVEANQLASRRTACRNKITKLHLRQLAERWLAGVEIEELAAELAVPADLLWDAVANEISKMGPHNPPTKLLCSGVCSYSCTKQCAMQVKVHDRAQVPGAPPPSKARTERREGVPYVRTGLRLPAPGRGYSRWGP